MCQRSAPFVHSTYPSVSYEDSPMTTPASSVPASQLARSARSEDVVAKHKKYLWPSVTNYFQHPLVADRGEMQAIFFPVSFYYLLFFGGFLAICLCHSYANIERSVAIPR